jgi:hypothetical protein
MQMIDFDKEAERLAKMSDVSMRAFVFFMSALTICAGAAVYAIMTCSSG